MFPFDLHLNKGLSNRPAGDLRHYRAHYDVNVMHGVCRNLVEYGKDRIKIKLVWVEWRQIIFVYSSSALPAPPMRQSSFPV